MASLSHSLRRARTKVPLMGGTFAVTLALFAAMLTGASPASAGLSPGTVLAPSTSGWRIAAVIGASRASNLLSVVATSPHSAWAFGDGVHGKPLALHWNGTAWLPGPLPQANARPDLISAASPADVWAGGTRCGDGPPSSPFSSYVSRWNGRSWSTTTFRHVNWCAQTLVTTNYGNGWLFTSQSLALHLQSGRWQPVQLGNVGAVITATAVSATDIWAFTYRTSDDKLLAIHWNGRSWRPVPLPAFPAPRHKHSYPWSSYSSTRTGVWFSESAVPGLPYWDARLVRWTGHSWRQISPPTDDTFLALTGDGAGGLWGLAFNRGQVFQHYAGGSWTGGTEPIAGLPGNPARVADLVYDLANIPGTRSLWATGQADYYNSKDVQQSYSVIYQYTP
jgi:hypothetical protein